MISVQRPTAHRIRRCRRDAMIRQPSGVLRRAIDAYVKAETRVAVAARNDVDCLIDVDGDLVANGLRPFVIESVLNCLLFRSDFWTEGAPAGLFHRPQSQLTEGSLFRRRRALEPPVRW